MIYFSFTYHRKSETKVDFFKICYVWAKIVLCASISLQLEVIHVPVIRTPTDILEQVYYISIKLKHKTTKKKQN